MHPWTPSLAPKMVDVGKVRRARQCVAKSGPTLAGPKLDGTRTRVCHDRYKLGPDPHILNLAATSPKVGRKRRAQYSRPRRPQIGRCRTEICRTRLKSWSMPGQMRSNPARLFRTRPSLVDLKEELTASAPLPSRPNPVSTRDALRLGQPVRLSTQTRSKAG